MIFCHETKLCFSYYVMLLTWKCSRTLACHLTCKKNTRGSESREGKERKGGHARHRKRKSTASTITASTEHHPVTSTTASSKQQKANNVLSNVQGINAAVHHSSLTVVWGSINASDHNDIYILYIKKRRQTVWSTRPTQLLSLHGHLNIISPCLITRTHRHRQQKSPSTT